MDLLLVQLSEMTGAKKLILDFPTWDQCFATFAAMLGAHNLSILDDLMTYRNTSQKVLADNKNFCQDIDCNPELGWIKLYMPTAS